MIVGYLGLVVRRFVTMFAPMRLVVRIGLVKSLDFGFSIAGIDGR